MVFDVVQFPISASSCDVHHDESNFATRTYVLSHPSLVPLSSLLPTSYFSERFAASFIRLTDAEEEEVVVVGITLIPTGILSCNLILCCYPLACTFLTFIFHRLCQHVAVL